MTDVKSSPGRKYSDRAKINQSRKFISLAATRSAQPVKHLCGAILWTSDHCLQRLARAETCQRTLDEGMMRHHSGKAFIDRFRAIGLAVSGQEPGVSVGKTQRVPVAFEGRLEPAPGFAGVAEIVGDEARMIVPKSGYRGIANSVERIQCMMQVRLARIAPGREERRRHVSGTRVACGQLHARRGVLPQFDRVNRGREAGETAAGIAREEALAEDVRVLLIAVRERGRKGALKQVRVSRVNPKRFAIVGLGGRGVAVGAGD